MRLGPRKRTTLYKVTSWGLQADRTLCDRTFPGSWHHLSCFFNTFELGVGYTAVASATALSQVPCSASTLGSALCAPTCADSRQAGKEWAKLLLRDR